MDSNFEKLKSLIDASDLDVADKENLWQVFSGAAEADLVAVVELFGQDASWIEKMNQNIKAKQQAFQQGDHRQWSDILEEEKRWIAEIV